MIQRDEIVIKGWATLENRLSQEKHKVFHRIIPFFREAKKHPILKKLYPFLSHEYLCFSLNTAYPWSENYPCIGPIPSVIEFNVLVAIKKGVDFKTSVSLIQRFLNKYPFLFEKKQPYMIFDEHHVMIDLLDSAGAINWILEQTQEMYTVFGRGTAGFPDHEILGITDIHGTLDLLVERIRNINPDL